MGKYILALDQGTTSSRAILFDSEQNILGISQKEFTQIYPQEGWVEHDAMEIWSSQYAVMMEVVAQSGVDAADIAGIGITNQRETTILWDRRTGRPIHNAIVWQCRRTADIVDGLLADGLGTTLRTPPAWCPTPTSPARKSSGFWTMWRVPGRGGRGEILFGTVDTWLLWKLTGGRSTSPTTPTPPAPCSTTSTSWIGTKKCWTPWTSPAPCCPRYAPPAKFTATPRFRARGCPIAGIAGDQQAALFGQTCFQPGDAKNTYGTGCFLLMNTGTPPVGARTALSPPSPSD